MIYEFACLDLDRERRLGLPEVVYCEGKPPAHAARIIAELAAAHGRVLGTRACAVTAAAIGQAVPDAVYDEVSRTVTVRRCAIPATGRVLVAAAGTCDIPVAEEAAVTASMMGADVLRAYDVGVAGLHRLLAQVDKIRQADVAVVVAGMEGALTSVLGGLAPCPVIGVPTSVGYGTGAGGLAAVLSMLNSCAPGVMVVNIDNGFGAGYAAGKIASLRGKGPAAAG